MNRDENTSEIGEVEMTKLEYPGFILWWKDKNRFPLAVAENGRPWYLWPEDTPKKEPDSPTLPAMWLANTPIRLRPG